MLPKQMKRFEVRIGVRSPTNELVITSLDVVQSDNIFELLTQITFILLRIQREEFNMNRVDDDDIPF